ncbi:MAG: DUF1573 domain-containing protein [Bacteroidota bacterium]
MKKAFFLLAICASLIACQTTEKKISGPVLTKEQKDNAIKDSSNFTSIKWLDSTYMDLGKIKEGQQVEVTFRFKNIGTKNLVIDDVTASCGCTVPEKPEQAFIPGEEGVIKAKFDSKDKFGEVNKQVYVTANTNEPNPMVLNFRAEIIK